MKNICLFRKWKVGSVPFLFSLFSVTNGVCVVVYGNIITDDLRFTFFDSDSVVEYYINRKRPTLWFYYFSLYLAITKRDSLCFEYWVVVSCNINEVIKVISSVVAVVP